jgi:predicted nucleotidyltransferase
VNAAATKEPRLEEALTRLSADLRAALGGDLKAVVLYGGLAKGRYTPGFSDVNVLVVLEDASFAVLRRLAPVLTAAGRSHGVAPLVVTPADLRAMGRLFPVKLLDIQTAHRVLEGSVNLEEFQVDRSALRLRAAQEITNLRWRLRQRLAERGERPELLWGGLVQSLPSLAVTLGAELRARGSEVPRARGDVLRAAGRELGLSTDAMAQIAGLHRHEPRPDDDRVYALFETYLGLLEVIARELEGAS